MTNVDKAGDPGAKRMRRVARGVGSFVAAFWLFAGIGSGMAESGPMGLEDAIMAVLITSTVVGVAVAWWRERIGGTMLLVCAVAHSTFAYFAAGHNKGFAMLISGGPWLVVGLLFLASWRRSRRSRGPLPNPPP